MIQLSNLAFAFAVYIYIYIIKYYIYAYYWCIILYHDGYVLVIEGSKWSFIQEQQRQDPTYTISYYIHLARSSTGQMTVASLDFLGNSAACSSKAADCFDVSALEEPPPELSTLQDIGFCSCAIVKTSPYLGYGQICGVRNISVLSSTPRQGKNM